MTFGRSGPLDDQQLKKRKEYYARQIMRAKKYIEDKPRNIPVLLTVEDQQYFDRIYNSLTPEIDQLTDDLRQQTQETPKIQEPTEAFNAMKEMLQPHLGTNNRLEDIKGLKDDQIGELLTNFLIVYQAAKGTNVATGRLNEMTIPASPFYNIFPDIERAIIEVYGSQDKRATNLRQNLNPSTLQKLQKLTDIAKNEDWYKQLKDGFIKRNPLVSKVRVIDEIKIQGSSKGQPPKRGIPTE